MIQIKNRPLARETLAEFLGTFILMVFGIGVGAQFVMSRGSMGTPTGASVTWGIGVMMGLFVSGGVSGGHINPAVSVAMAVLGRLPWFKVPFYCAAQYLGAFVASAFVFFVYWDALDAFDGGVRQVYGENATAGLWATYPQTYVSVWTSFGDQIFATAVLLICVMGISDPRNMQPPTGLFPICIGFCVMGMSMSYSLNCGNAMNPARDLSPRLFTAIAGWNLDPFRVNNYNYFWVNIVGPHVGAVVGAFIYQYFIGYHWPLPESKDTYIGDQQELKQDQQPSTPEKIKRKSREAESAITKKEKETSDSLASTAAINKAFESDGEELRRRSNSINVNHPK